MDRSIHWILIRMWNKVVCGTMHTGSMEGTVRCTYTFTKLTVNTVVLEKQIIAGLIEKFLLVWCPEVYYSKCHPEPDKI